MSQLGATHIARDERGHVTRSVRIVMRTSLATRVRSISTAIDASTMTVLRDDEIE
jgi:hypothetical protein